MFKQVLSELSRRDSKKYQNLYEVDMAKVYDDLDSIMVKINERGFSDDLIQPLSDVLLDLKEFDQIIDQADKLAQRFLESQCNGKGLSEKQTEIWSSKRYPQVFECVWDDIQDIVRTCRMIKEPLSNQTDSFSKYIEFYLKSMDEFAKKKLSASDYVDFKSKIEYKCTEGKAMKGEYVVFAYKKISGFYPPRKVL
jgi:hypothetical protein